MDKKPVTRKDIAELCEVSISVVSRALNNSGYVEESKRKKIIATAERLGYVPQPVAMSLQERRTKQLLYYCKDLNNEYYLDHDFYGNYSQPGTVFADFRCVVNDYDFNQSDNIVLYGHNQANGAMFGTLQKYKITKQSTKKFDFYLQHPTFTFSNLYEEYTYKIIALFVCEVEPEQTTDGNVFDYHNYIRFGSKERTYEEFISSVEERSEIITGVDVQEGDKFMTLSTCSNEFEPSRFVVIGRRVRDGESPEVDTSLAKLNPDAKEPDWNYIYSR